MFHLVNDAKERIEANLIWAKQFRDGVFAWWFNLVLLVVVVGGFGFFLYSNHGVETPAELKAIDYKPVPWMNAVRNVPTTDYGQTPQIETGGGVSGYGLGSSASSF